MRLLEMSTEFIDSQSTPILLYKQEEHTHAHTPYRYLEVLPGLKCTLPLDPILTTHVTF